MKSFKVRILQVIALAFFVGLLFFFAYKNQSNNINKIDENTKIVEETIDENKVVSYDEIEEAKENVEFDVYFPEVIEAYGDREISVIDDNTFEAIYHFGDKTLTMRKSSIENKDISGTNESFENTETLYVNNLEITVKGNNNLYNLALWTNNGYSYSVYFSEGIDKTIILSAIVSIL